MLKMDSECAVRCPLEVETSLTQKRIADTMTYRRHNSWWGE